MQKLALVTGGIRGIGESISLDLKHAGYKVVANYTASEDKAKEFEDRTGIKTYKWDVSDYDECLKNIKKIEEDFGQSIDILINNAGITRDAMMHKMANNYWHEVINTNLNSCFNMSQSVINQMRDKNFGRIINISSINGLAGQAGQTNYSAAKSGMIGFTKALAKEAAAKGVTVNAVAPGYIATEMTAKIDEKIIENIKSQIPVKKFGDPKDISRTVLFLASDDAGFITGETISVNGGQYM